MKDMNEMILCACGCGNQRLKYTYGREREFIRGHVTSNHFKKGERPSISTEFKRGHSLPKEIELVRRMNISHGRKGIKFSQQHCNNISTGRRGLPNPKVRELLKGAIGSKSRNWKGGITPINKILRHTDLYKNWRTSIFQRDNFTCQNINCGFCSNVNKGTFLHAHHIRKFSQNPSLRFDINNGITLCDKFHMSINGNEEKYEDVFLNKVMRTTPTEVLCK